MMDNLNSEAIFYGATFTTKSGWKVTLQLPDQALVDQLNAIGAGKRYMLAMVPIADDETPDVEAMQKPKRRLDEMPLSQVAGMLCQDENFAKFLNVKQWRDMGYSGHDHQACAGIIREKCGVTSRSEIIRGTPAGDKFEKLRTEYDAWRGKIARPE